MQTQPAKSRTLNLGGLQLDLRATVIVVASTLLLMFDYYHRILPGDTFAAMLRAKAIERSIYYLAIPFLIIVAVFRDRPSDYGFTLGDWRQGLKWTAFILLPAVPILALAAHSPAMIDYYSRFPGDLRQLIPTAFLDLVGWEFIFRGFLLFGLMRLMGPTAVVVQAVPFALAHLGKPELETLSTIFGGALFGWVAWRTRSFVYPFFIHWFIYIFVVLVAHA
jgi:membrane protease YdiL (CAAX protease family)